MSDLPSGMVTLLFTDIESSTDRWEEDVEAMTVSLAAHDAVLDAAIERRGGRRFKHTGDGVCAVFSTPSAAVRAALDAQADLELPVRMGLHTGEVEAREGDFFGPTLNRCARIMDAGHGGQVLVSSATAELIDGFDLVELGAFALKGIERASRIYQVGTDVFPPLRARRSSNLPAFTSSLIGRDALVTDVARILGGCRVVALVGVGGVGKTRLALEVARQVETSFDATFFVGLQEIDNDDEVLDAVGLALDLKTPTLGSLTTALAHRRTLIVLDNCEHVLDGVVDVLDHVISHAEGCHVLATSREGLAMDGERVIPVPTLGVDDEGPAVALFVERARARGHGLDAAGDLTAIASICARLDGLPLAIELAAARVGVLSPPELLERLDERFRLLTGSRRRRGRDRQRTLEETIEWSYDLLDPDDRVAFARLAVFAGSFDLAGAAAVLQTDELDALDLLETLVDRSLLTVDDHLTGRRYRYLETIRAYAERCLHDSGASDEVLEVLHRQLVAAMPELAERFREHMRIEAARLERETPNLRRAFDWAIQRQDAPAATELVQPFIAMIGLIVWPIHGWADEVLALPDVADTVHEPVLRLLQANDRHLDNQFRELKETCLRMLDLDHTPRPLPDEMIISVALLLTLVGEYQACEELLEERSAAGLRSWADPVPEMYLALRKGAPIDHLVAEVGPVGEFGRAMVSYYESLRLGREGLNAEAREVQRDALEFFVVDSPYWFGTLQLAMSVELAASSVTDALELADLDLEHAYRIADRSAMIMPLACYATALRQLGEVEVAAILRGRLPRRLTVYFEDELVELDTWLGENLDEPTCRELAARGEQMEPRELRDLARSIITQPQSRT